MCDSESGFEEGVRNNINAREIEEGGDAKRWKKTRDEGGEKERRLAAGGRYSYVDSKGDKQGSQILKNTTGIENEEEGFGWQMFLTPMPASWSTETGGAQAGTWGRKEGAMRKVETLQIRC